MAMLCSLSGSPFPVASQPFLQLPAMGWTWWIGTDSAIFHRKAMILLWFDLMFHDILSDWWLTYPSEKWWTKSGGMMTFPIYGKIKLMFQTTNQFCVLPRRNWRSSNHAKQLEEFLRHSVHFFLGVLLIQPPMVDAQGIPRPASNFQRAQPT